MFKTSLYRIKPDKKGIWLGWCGELEHHYADELAEILQAEGVEHEFVIYFELDGVDYTLLAEVYFPDRSQGFDASELSQRHMAMKKHCLEKVFPSPDKIMFASAEQARLGQPLANK